MILSNKFIDVLILVFVEFTLREVKREMKNFRKKCLNPCFCGIYSQRDMKNFKKNLKKGLNPCFCGIYSQSWRCPDGCELTLHVLILVFVEFTLRDCQIKKIWKILKSLNPCFCGIYSQRVDV